MPSFNHNQTNGILIVDDTPANLKVLISMLSEQGHRVRPAINGNLALTAAQKAPPDLILLDISMPDMDGYEVCRRLKADEITRDIPVIFISALNEPLDKVKAFTVGGVDYITKPFHVEEVLARVKTHLTLHQLQTQLAETNQDLEKRVAARTIELTRTNAQLREQIAERQQAEQALRKSEATNRALLNAIPDLMFRLNEAGTLLPDHQSRRAIAVPDADKFVCALEIG
jgi:PleD family two-component response regulator